MRIIELGQTQNIPAADNFIGQPQGRNACTVRERILSSDRAFAERTAARAGGGSSATSGRIKSLAPAPFRDPWPPLTRSSRLSCNQRPSGVLIVAGKCELEERHADSQNSCRASRDRCDVA